MNNRNSSLIGGALLIAGTSVGGGMLALPVLTSLGGFIPSILIFVLCWLFMASTGLLFLEVSLVMDKGANIVSMAQRTLGKGGLFAAWTIYLFQFYCLTLAYIVGCGNLVTDAFSGHIPAWAGPLLFVLCFGPMIFSGTRLVGKVNVFLMLGLFISFIAFCTVGFQFIRPDFLIHQNWPLSLMSLPIAFTSFAYQGIIPTLVNHMNHDAKKIRLAILIGSSIPLVTYIIWQGLILGIVPLEGPNGLREALEQGQNAVHPLKHFIQNPAVYTIGSFFAFFALVTSFFGVTLGLMDFFADGFKIKKTPLNKFYLCLLIFIPPLIISFWHPDVFLMALDYAGGLGCASLLGVLPILMVWSLRYKLGVRSPYQLNGGKTALIVLMIFVLFELGWELLHIAKSVVS